MRHIFRLLTAAAILVVPMLAMNRTLAFNVNNPSGSQSVCSSGSAATSSYCNETANGGSNKVSGTGGVILTAVNVISFIGGAAAVMAIIIGGFRFVISGGDSNQVNGARNMIIYAAIGIVVIAVSQTIVRFILGKL